MTRQDWRFLAGGFLVGSQHFGDVEKHLPVRLVRYREHDTVPIAYGTTQTFRGRRARGQRQWDRGTGEGEPEKGQHTRAHGGTQQRWS